MICQYQNKKNQPKTSIYGTFVKKTATKLFRDLFIIRNEDGAHGPIIVSQQKRSPKAPLVVFVSDLDNQEIATPLSVTAAALVASSNTI